MPQKPGSTHNNLYTIGFYNLENLFDTENDLKTDDDDFTAEGELNWHSGRYDRKLYKLGKVISTIGYGASKKAPVIMGLAEVENAAVVAGLLETKHLKNHDFAHIHYDSPDNRGIDTALIYQKRFFEPLSSTVEPVLIVEKNGERDFTRDILHVEGKLNGERMHILVNHWPSRREGEVETRYKRIEAAKTVHKIVNKIKANEEDPAIIIMGDFNDDPFSASIKEYLMTPDFYNPMETLLHPFQQGSLNHKQQWNLFDQIIFSNNFFDFKHGTHAFAHAAIFDEEFITNFHGHLKGTPFRTYAGRKYLGGFSDHFPVYVQLKKY